MTRRTERGPVERAFVQKLDELRPDLARSVLMSARLQLERARIASETLAALGLPALVLNEQGKVLAANSLIEALTLPQAPPVELVQSLFDLTPAEARVARDLASGKTVEDIASDGGTSPNTIRSHVRGVLEKTGCNRQTDVVALLTTISSARLPRDADRPPANGAKVAGHDFDHNPALQLYLARRDVENLHPIELTPTRLLRLSKNLPHDWKEQRRFLDFAA